MTTHNISFHGVIKKMSVCVCLHVLRRSSITITSVGGWLNLELNYFERKNK